MTKLHDEKAEKLENKTFVSTCSYKIKNLI